MKRESDSRCVFFSCLPCFDKCVCFWTIRYLEKHGVDVGEASFFVHVRDCVEMTSMPDGSIEKHFSDTETMHPIQVILRSNPFEKAGKNHIRTATQKKLMQSLKPGSKVVYVVCPFYSPSPLLPFSYLL